MWKKIKKELPPAPIQLVAPSREEDSRDVASEEKVQEPTDDTAKAQILMRSTPVDEASDSWSEEDYDSSDLEVAYESEDEEMDNHVILSRVRRLGNVTHKHLWRNSMEFYSVVLAFLISPDAIISAIYGFRKFGAQIWYPTAMGAFFIGFPVMLMEIALGQYTSTSSVSVFKFIAPAFAAISLLSAFMNMLVTLNDLTIFVMTVSVLRDLLASHSDQLVAMSCFNSWNSIACENAIQACASITSETGHEYISIQGRCVQKRWYTEILTKDIHMGETLRTLTPQFKYLVTFLTSVDELGNWAAYWPCTDLLVYISLIFVILLIIYAVPERSAVFIVKIPILMIFVFFGTVLLSSSTGDSDANHSGFPIKNDPINWESNEFKIWVVGHVFLVSKIGQGSLISIGSQNPFRSHLFKQVFVLIIFAFSVPHLFAYLIYPYMDKLLWNSVQDWTLFNEKKAEFFNAEGAGFNTLWSDVLMAFFADAEHGELFGNLFILTMASIFIVHKILRIMTLKQPAEEKFGLSNVTDLGISKIALLLFLHLFYYNQHLIPNRTVSLHANMGGCAFVIIFEVICVVCCYGPRRFLCTLNLMTFGVLESYKEVWRMHFRETFNLLLPCIFALLTCVVCPYIFFHIFWATYIWIDSGGNLIYGISIALFLLSIIPVYGMCQIWDRYSKNNLIINLFKPIPDLWGPREEHDRRRAEFQERQMRVAT